MKKQKAHDKKEKNKGQITIPYIKGTSEKVARAYHQKGYSVTYRPHITLRKLLVHPKEKINQEDMCGVVYDVHCHNCSKHYVGETGRKLKLRLAEHRNEVKKKDTKVRTRSDTTETQFNQSAITTMSWSKVTYQISKMQRCSVERKMKPSGESKNPSG